MTSKTRKFYPTPSNITYYIGDLLIDDIFRVDFMRKISHQPIWGYDSQKYDFVAQGKEIVTGNIIINFRYPGYLKNAINRFNAGNVETVDQVKQRFEEDKRVTYSPSFFATLDSLDITNRAKVIGTSLLLKHHKANAIGSIDTAINQVKKDIRKVYGNNSEETNTDDANFFKSPLDEKGIFQFDLVVRYGFQNIAGGFIRKFKDCVLLGESETISASAGAGGDMSSSAQPVLEVYPFFARTIEVLKSN